MKIPIQILGFLLISHYCCSQYTIAGKIIDNETKEALAYVNIGILDSSRGTVSDDEGKFSINVESEESILEFSHLGYEALRKSVKAENNDMTISLEPNAFQLEEINIVSSNFDKELLLGVKNTKGRGKSIGFGNAQLGTELGALIKIEKETFVKSVNFVLNHAKGDSILLRVNMYDYENNEIGEKVLQHNIYIKEKQRKGAFTVNLEEYEIILKNDILLSLEWLRNYDEEGNKLITFDTKKSRKMRGTYIRSSKTSEFIRLPFKRKLKPCIYLIGRQSSK